MPPSLRIGRASPDLVPLTHLLVVYIAQESIHHQLLGLALPHETEELLVVSDGKKNEGFWWAVIDLTGGLDAD